MKINSKDFRVRPGAKVKLKDWPTKVKPFLNRKSDMTNYWKKTLKS